MDNCKFYFFCFQSFGRGKKFNSKVTDFFYRSINELGSNFVSYETKTDIGSAVLNFESQRVGHTILTQMLQQLNKYFEETLKTKNSSELLTKTIFNLCIDGQVFLINSLFNNIKTAHKN